MAKIYERLLSTNLLWEKRRTRLIPNVKICDSICMVNLMEIPRVIVIFCHVLDRDKTRTLGKKNFKKP